jgi:hypothetical protein
MSVVSRGRIGEVLADGGGILRLQPCWVARNLARPGRRLGLPDAAYDLGERGAICERWLASTTRADNRIGPEDEGLSYIDMPDGSQLTLRDAVEAAPAMIMGETYAASHGGLERLAKILDYGSRLPFHLHPRARHASLVGRRQKDEAYYFPEGYDLGPHPETFFGVHPWLSEGRGRETLLPYLVKWDSDLVLRHSQAYLQVPMEGFHVPSGVLHAPGTAVTVELQEDSDVFAMLQAVNDGWMISKELMFKDVRPEDRASFGELFILELIDWEANTDPYFYENHHLSLRADPASEQAAGSQSWIFYNTSKFSGKRLAVRPSSTYRSIDAGVYSLLVLSGRGHIGGHEVQAGFPGRDELLIASDTAIRGVDVVNDDPLRELVVLKFYGPDVNRDVPKLPLRPSRP